SPCLARHLGPLARRAGTGRRRIAAAPLCPYPPVLVRCRRGTAAGTGRTGGRAPTAHLACLSRGLRIRIRPWLGQCVPAAGGQAAAGPVGARDRPAHVEGGPLRRLNAGWPGAYLDRRAAGAAGSVGTVVRAPPRYGRRLPRAELRGCHRQRPGPGPRRLRPGRPDEPHGAHPLDGADAVDGAADRPPAVARRLHEARALEPSLAAARWPVTAVAATLELEAEELEPVAQARQRDHLALPRKERAQQPRGDGTANPPQADRIEPGEHHPALGPKHTV